MSIKNSKYPQPKGRTITFGERWTPRSYRVSYDGPYKNTTPPHVQTDQEGLTGKTFSLGVRQQFPIRTEIAIMYEVIGVKNREKPAHLTVYLGDGTKAEKY